MKRITKKVKKFYLFTFLSLIFAFNLGINIFSNFNYPANTPSITSYHDVSEF